MHATYHKRRQCAKLAAVVQEIGVLSIGDLAGRFKLPVDYLQAIILPQVGQAFPGRVHGQLIFTDAFIARVQAQVSPLRVCSLTAITACLNIQS